MSGRKNVLPSDGPVSRVVSRRGEVNVKTLLFFTERMTFELNPLWLRAFKDDEVQWTVRCYACKVLRGQGDQIVLSSAKRVVVFQADDLAETKDWYHALQLATGQSIEPFIQLDEIIGRGAFGHVHIAKCKGMGYEGDSISESRVAVKVIQKSKTAKSLIPRLRREIDIQQRLTHANVVRLQDAFETKGDIYLIMELISGGMLVDRLKELTVFSENDAKRVMLQLFDAVGYLHRRGIVHRDLKLDNILCKDLASFEVAIADFGLAGRLTKNELEQDNLFDPYQCPSASHLRSFVGTPLYMAPEITGDNAYDQAVDLWSLGIVLYALLCGELPVYEPLEEQDSFVPITAAMNSPAWTKVSEDARNLVDCLLSRDPLKRVTAEEALQHPWFQQENTEGSVEHLDIDFSKVRESEKNLRVYVHLILAANKFKHSLNHKTSRNQEERRPIGDQYHESIDDEEP